MNDNIFSGLEKLGFNDIHNVDLYNTASEKEAKKHMENKLDNNNCKFLYKKEILCPVCNNKFKEKAVKTSAYVMDTKDSDFFIRYRFINPYFYDVWVCPCCGYSAMKADFLKIKSHEISLVKEKITPRWKKREYPEEFNADIAIERYKLALLNYYITETVSSKKAMACLKLAWMYRLKNLNENENEFLNQALNGFENAFFKESLPIYGMDRYTTMYLIGEINRRIGNDEKALLWFSKVITQPGVKFKLKELARDQRDLIKALNR
ncbi:DUF2225 domain-containing protein [Haloimpatiens lingqiaonensis]|uniref:DUF2225 domain-containing protein n=1 Tax=Haloimpatiens lingqiaonensis TaxID=1380675 RepID=UPI001FA9A5A2|nr:DUF2225 domain-containing protein [Haloimpatiens lingqiaonensis]